jgi:hypothetical protein
MSQPEGKLVPIDPKDIPGLLRAKEILEQAKPLVGLLLQQEINNIERLARLAEAEGLREVQELRDRLSR